MYLGGVDDGVQVGGGPHVLEVDPRVGLDVADDDVALHHAVVLGEADARPPLVLRVRRLHHEVDHVCVLVVTPAVEG